MWQNFFSNGETYRYQGWIERVKVIFREESQYKSKLSLFRINITRAPCYSKNSTGPVNVIAGAINLYDLNLP